jgi:hypothetical protein
MIKVWESKNSHDKFLLITYRGKGTRKVETLKIPLEYITEAIEEGARNDV